ncbi:MAG: HYR domain-containing protein [Saprospiraceae bacterium]
MNSIDVSCFAANNGTASVDDSGSTSSFTYNWSNGATTSSVSDLPAGTYEVSISDDLGCESVEEFVITEPAAVAVELITTTPNCTGENNGSITLNTTGGSGQYTYNWQDGSTGSDFQNASAGLYAVTATDSNGCSEIQTVEITDPILITASTTSTNTSSANTNDGTATVDALGGNGIFSFQWSNGETTQTITDLAPGIYEVVITDGNGCTTTTSATVQGVDCFLTSSINNTNVNCAEDANGSATITITGGSGDFQYEWSNDATTQTISDLEPGTYTVTATDLVGCAIVDQITIIAPQVINTVPMDVNHPNCNNSTDGSIELETTGGTGLYTYLWSNGSTNEDLINAPAGEYTIEITDANGCTSSATFSLTAPAELVSSISDQTNVQCGNDGSGTATIVAEGGSGTITYEWSNGQTSETATGLNAGTYDVVATDANGCAQTNSVTITAQDDLPPVVATQAVSLSLDDDGVATLAAMTVDNNSSDNCELAGMSLDINQFDCSNIGENIVQLTVTDGAGNTSMATAMVTVVDNTDPTIECAAAVVNGSCSEPVEYDLPTAFDNCSADQPELLIGLGSGAVFPVGNSIEVYRVTDASGNSATCSFTVMVADDVDPELECPANLVLTGCEQEVNYSLPTASDACSVVGEPVLTMGMGTGATFPEGLSTEIYEVADAAGNTATCSFTIQINNTIDGDISEIQNSCYDESNGSATVLGQGGVPPYDYAWDNGQTGTTATDLSPDLYAVVVTDASGCSNEVFVTVTSNPEIVTALDNLENESGNSSNGSIDITSTGGSGNLTFEWTADNGFSSVEEDIDGLSAGTYSCIITDEEGCSTIAGPFVVASASSINDPKLDNEVSIYPNPTEGEVQVHLSNNITNEDVQFEVFSITGQEVGIQSIAQPSNNMYTMDISNQVNGVYLVKIRIGEDLLVKRIVLSRK